VTRTPWVGLGAAAALLLASCSASKTDYQDAAKNVIEGDLQTSLGMGELSARCEQPPSDEVGTTFACTATTADGQTISLDAEIQDDNKVFVQTTNVITADNLTTIEAEAARILSEQVGQTLPAENIDCGGQAVVATAGDPFVCALTDPADPNVVYDASITLDDLANPSHLEVEVANAPRS
jgi:hypothetical protein